jgi:Na+/H+ antiporter NhaD/arsenite permease-like protein
MFNRSLPELTAPCALRAASRAHSLVRVHGEPPIRASGAGASDPGAHGRAFLAPATARPAHARRALEDPMSVSVAGICVKLLSWPCRWLARPFGRCHHRLALGVGAAGMLTLSAPAVARAAALEPLHFAGVPVDFILFGLMLLGVAVFHHHTLKVALAGLAAVTLYKLGFTGFKSGAGLPGLAEHLRHEWVILANLFLLLMGFALLSRHFEKSRVPAAMPRFLADDWKGGFVLLLIVAVLSSFLDNIAAALIGGTMAQQVFRGKVHIGYLAAIVAAANAGGAGSVVGDTTTTMMWIHGVSPLRVLSAFIAAAVALVVCAIPAAIQQQRFSPIIKDAPASLRIEWTRLLIVALILSTAILANVLANVRYPELLDAWPLIGMGVWGAILLATPLRAPDWQVLPETFKGTVFLLALVICASMMPVEELPLASWQTALGLGFVSAVFDNIPLTALALKQGGYDWGYLAYAVGFGGSIIWFGSSAGVALANMYPDAKSAGRWVLGGWHVTVGYVAGFFVMLAVLGWHPDPPHRKRVDLRPMQTWMAAAVQPLAR